MRTEDPAAGNIETGANCGDLEDDDTDTLVDDGCPMYLLADHLGGTTHVLDSAGIVRSGQRYWPYGAVRSGGISETDVQYTGQRAEPGDAALGLYNYKARFYSTTLGRFVSPDSLVPSVDDGQALNRYTYVRSLPTSLTDPSGHCFKSISGEDLPCSPDAAKSWFDCAMGGCSGDPALEAFAKQGVSQLGFWSEVYLFLESGSVSLHLLGTFVRYASSDPTRWHEMPELGWRYFSVLAHVPQAYFKASLFALMYGDVTRIYQLELGQIAGAYAWWDRNDLSWGLSPFQRMFTARRRSMTNLATFERTLHVAAMQLNLAEAQIPWHQDQRVAISHALGVSPPDYWGGDVAWHEYWKHVAQCNFLGCDTSFVRDVPFWEPFSPD